MNDFLFCPTLREMLISQKVVGRSGKKFDNLGALSTVNNLIILRNLLMAFKPERTLEIGLAFGGSCLTFASSHRDFGAAHDNQHIAIDPFQTQVWDDAGLLAVERAGLSGYMNFRQSYSSQELPKLMEDKMRFGLVYVDGSHLFEDVFVDFYFINRLLSQGALVAFDDSTDPHVRKVLQFIKTNFASSYQIVDLTPFRSELPDVKNRLKRLVASRLGKNQLTVFRKVGKTERKWDTPFTDF